MESTCAGAATAPSSRRGIPAVPGRALRNACGHRAFSRTAALLLTHSTAPAERRVEHAFLIDVVLGDGRGMVNRPLTYLYAYYRPHYSTVGSHGWWKVTMVTAYVRVVPLLAIYRPAYPSVTAGMTNSPT